ncbi:MAG: hypothetical protein ACLF0P_06405 [Thermoanaerobaculia bacterium]
MKRRLAFALAALAGAAFAAPAAAQTVVRHLEVEAGLAERQAAALLERYEAARARQQAARARADELAAQLDRRLRGEGGAEEQEAGTERLTSLERRLTDAELTAEGAGELARDLRRGILAETLRRELIEAELQRHRAGPADVPDPLTGAWELSLQPGDNEGVMDLTLEGTRVVGTLGLDDGSFGSVEGSLSAGSLRLQRVSAEGGLDLVLEGRLDPDSGGLSGTWRPLVLGRGEPPGGTWTARRTSETGSGGES